MLQAAHCIETVSIARAIVFGADGACVDIGLASLLGGVALFMGCVLALRFAGATLLRRAVPSLRRKTPVADPSTVTSPAEPEQQLARLPYESPIRSTGAWGRRG